MNLETAKNVVGNYYTAKEPSLTLLLEKSKGSDYRPFYVAAFFIASEYRQLIKADEATFAYDKKESVIALLNMQKPLDRNDPNIPEGFTIDDVLASINPDLPSFYTYGTVI